MNQLIGSFLDRSVIDAVGPDAASYLQGQLSSDVEALALGESGPSLLLAPDGKLIAPLVVVRSAESVYRLIVPTSVADAAFARLSRFKLRVDVELSEPQELRYLAVRGPGASELSPTDFGADAGIDPQWPLVEGIDLLGSVITAPDNVTIDDDAFEGIRIDNGIAEMGKELDLDTIPAVGGQRFIERSVSFTKGCYVGQELVARVDSRGSNTPTKLRKVTSAEPMNSGDVVLDSTGGDVGRVTSAHGTSGLAILKRSVDDGHTVSVGDARSAATVAEVV